MGPLQGSARVVKDNCADWSNYVDKWEELSNSGFKLANEIVNMKLQSNYQGKTSEEIQVHQLGEDSHKAESESLYPEGLDKMCNKFTALCDSMEKLVEKMSAITKRFRGIIDLEKYNSVDGELEKPLFQGWAANQFYECSKELEEMYSQELKLKKYIVEDIAHKSDRDVLMMYMSSWQNEPYIEQRAALVLESMLLETGQR